MAEPVDGVDALRARVERRSRSVPPPRRPRETPAETANLDETDHDVRGPTGGEEQPPTEEPDGSRGGERPLSVPAEAAEPPGAVPQEPTRPPSRPRRQVAEPPSPPGDNAPMRASQPPTTANGDEPTANLTLRVRQSLDFRLAELIHELRREGVRSSKKELIEMCLSELPAGPTEHLRTRLRSYRAQLPRDL